MNLIKKSKPVIKNLIRIWYIIIVLWIMACDRSGGDNSYGSLTLNMDFVPDSINMDNEAYHKAIAPEVDICDDYGVVTITVEVLTSGGQSVAKASWDCSRHSGKIDRIPAGTDYTVICSGSVFGDEHSWQGQVEQINVLFGENTHIDTIAMHYIGNDKSAPLLSYSMPADGEKDAVLNTSIVAAFDEPLSANSVHDKAISISTSGHPVIGQTFFHPGNNALYFQPKKALKPSTVYVVSLDASLPDVGNITDMAGNICEQDYQWSFTTGDAIDSQAPQVIETVPLAGAKDIDPYLGISATFDEPLNPAALKKELFTVSSGQTKISGRVVYDHSTLTLTFTPDTPIAYLTDYEVSIHSGVLDMAQNPMPEPSHTWTFRTMETQHELAVIKQGTGNGIITSVPAGIDCGRKCEARFFETAEIILQAVPDENSVFDSWSKKNCANNECTLSIQQDTELTAYFNLKTHIINASSNSGGSIKPSGSVAIDHGDGARFEFTADQGFFLVEFKVDGVSFVPSNFYEFQKVSKDCTIEAVFRPKAVVDQQVTASGNGQTWETAFKTIQEAISHAKPGDEIWVSEGTYSVNVPIVVDKPLTIRGGFAKTEYSFEDRSPDRRTIIEGNNTVGCVLVTAEASIDNFVFNNGRSGKGGGVSCTAPTALTNCTISKCEADDGGGIYSTGQLDIVNCTFIGNKALNGSGGAIFIQGTESHLAELNLSDSRFDDNYAYYDQYSQGGTFGGGAIFSNYTQTLFISDSDFTNNRGFNGGAIYVVNGDTAFIDACRFEKNKTRQPAGMGGAIYNKDCLLQVNHSIFTDNAGSDSGAIFAHPSPRTSHGISMISNSEFRKNTCPDAGAAVHLLEGILRIINCLFDGNDGRCAGAVCATPYTNLVVVNSTIVNNNGDIGGISAASNTSVVNSILWDNQSNSMGPDHGQVSSKVEVEYCDINQEGFEGIKGNIRAIPGFINSEGGDFKLTDGSPCIDKGSNDAQFLPSNDLDGSARITGPHVDIGAYEK